MTDDASPEELSLLEEIKKHPEIFNLTDDGMISLKNPEKMWADPDVQAAMQRLRELEEADEAISIIAIEQLPLLVARLAEYGLDFKVETLYDDDGVIRDQHKVTVYAKPEDIKAALERHLLIRYEKVQ